MTAVLEQLRQRADSLQRESALTGSIEGFLLFARENCNFVGLLSIIWDVNTLRLQQGGVPAKLFLQDCDLLQTLLAAPEHFLHQLARVWHERGLPAEVAEPLYAEVQSALAQLDTLTRSIRITRDRVAKPARISAGPEDLKRQIHQADEGKEWLPLKDAIARMRHGSPCPA